MHQPDRPLAPFSALWRIPAVIALVFCAIGSRMALGGGIPAGLPSHGSPALRALATAMIADTASADVAADAVAPLRHDLAFDSRLLLDIAETIYELPPVGVGSALPPRASLPGDRQT